MNDDLSANLEELKALSARGWSNGYGPETLYFALVYESLRLFKGAFGHIERPSEKWKHDLVPEGDQNQFQLLALMVGRHIHMILLRRSA